MNVLILMDHPSNVRVSRGLVELERQPELQLEIPDDDEMAARLAVAVGRKRAKLVLEFEGELPIEFRGILQRLEVR